MDDESLTSFIHTQTNEQRMKQNGRHTAAHSLVFSIRIIYVRTTAAATAAAAALVAAAAGCGSQFLPQAR